ncbi:fibronectin-like [Leptopilina heterotoma]|uniref:fibronectin-like n=1 Tax=Leptopilina heterotoma TaxID=63436 RepID=UPI001CA95440|nr:fibronectin-like [Leptopilina heterotoma]
MKFILFVAFAAIFTCEPSNASDKIKVLNVTTTTCSIYWRKPKFYVRTLLYLISANDRDSNYTFYPFYDSHPEFQYTLQTLEPATTYNISVTVDYLNGTRSDNLLTTECLTKPKTGIVYKPVRQLDVLDATDTTCKISWKNPEIVNESVKYVISAHDKELNFTTYRHFSPLMEVEYTLEGLKPGTKYNISVYIDYQENEVKTQCTTKPQLGHLTTLESTNTTCSIFWKKPVNDDQMIKYVINVVDNRHNVLEQRNWRRVTSNVQLLFHSEILLTLPNLQPGSKYDISVYNDYTNTTMSTKCITEPEIGQVTVLDTTNTTCTVFWRKPTNDYESLDYNINVDYTDTSFITYRYSTSLPEIKYTMEQLHPRTTYNISVYFFSLNTTFSTECTTDF